MFEVIDVLGIPFHFLRMIDCSSAASIFATHWHLGGIYKKSTSQHSEFALKTFYSDANVDWSYVFWIKR